MAKEFAKKFYNSKAWKKCRQSYIDYRISVDGGYCECCKEELGYMVHHKVLLTQNNINDPDISLNHQHLRYECKACHDKEEDHFIKSKEVIREGLMFDSNGDIIPIAPLKKDMG